MSLNWKEKKKKMLNRRNEFWTLPSHSVPLFREIENIFYGVDYQGILEISAEATTTGVTTVRRNHK